MPEASLLRCAAVLTAKLLDLGGAVINGSLPTISLNAVYQLAPCLLLHAPGLGGTSPTHRTHPLLHHIFRTPLHSLDVFHMPLVDVLFGLSDSVCLMSYIGGSVLLRRCH